MYEYDFTVTRVIDGDTVIGDIDLGFGVVLKARTIRLNGVNTPETRSKNLAEKALGKKAKAFVEENILGKSVTLKTIKDKKGSFGRILGNIYWICEDGYYLNMAEYLIYSKLGVEYSVKDSTKVKKALIEDLIEINA